MIKKQQKQLNNRTSNLTKLPTRHGIRWDEGSLKKEEAF